MGPHVGLSDFLLVCLFFVFFCSCSFFYICYKLLKLRIEFISEGDGFLASVEEETSTGYNVSAAEAGLPHNASVVYGPLCQCKPAPQKKKKTRDEGCFEIYEQY